MISLSMQFLDCLLIAYEARSPVKDKRIEQRVFMLWVHIERLLPVPASVELITLKVGEHTVLVKHIGLL